MRRGTDSIWEVFWRTWTISEMLSHIQNKLKVGDSAFDSTNHSQRVQRILPVQHIVKSLFGANLTSLTSPIHRLTDARQIHDHRSPEPRDRSFSSDSKDRSPTDASQTGTTSKVAPRPRASIATQLATKYPGVKSRQHQPPLTNATQH